MGVRKQENEIQRIYYIHTHLLLKEVVIIKNTIHPSNPTIYVPWEGYGWIMVSHKVL